MSIFLCGYFYVDEFALQTAPQADPIMESMFAQIGFALRWH
jgi:hypothetical protein